MKPPAFYDVKHFGMNIGVGRAKLIAEQEVVSSAEIGHFSAGLLDDESPGSNVPRMKVVLKETFEPPAGDIGEINRGAAETTNAVRLVKEVINDIEVNAALVKLVIGEAGREKSFV